MIDKIVSLILIFSLSLCLTGCAAFDGLVNRIQGHPPQANFPEEPRRRRRPASEKRYSAKPNLQTGPEREYKRMTRKRMSDEASLNSNSGSLWQKQGQSGFLFSENPLKMIGDYVGVRVEGDPREQLNEKAKTIRRLIAKLKERRERSMKRQAMRRRMRRRELASLNGEPLPPLPKDSTVRKQPAPKPVAKVDDSDVLDFKKMKTRVVDQLPDGNYKVKGSRPILISNREYRVIVDGIVRPEDFQGTEVSADKLMDAKFDIVSTRRKGISKWQ